MARLFWFLALFLLYAPVVEVADYFLTVGGIAALILVVGWFPYGRPAAIGVVLALAAYPLLVYFAHLSLDSLWVVELSEFGGSYALWAFSAALITAGFFYEGKDLRIPENLLLGVLTALGIAQIALARLFGSTLGFDLVAPLISFDIYDSYLNIFQIEYARAIGPYYEPSIFGRIIATLAATLLIRTNKPLLPIAYIVINTFTTQSLGLLALGFLIFGLWYGRLSARWIPLAFVMALALLASYTFVASRLEQGALEGGSTYIRLIAPLEALAYVLTGYPFGLPLGSNELVVRALLAPSGFLEPKITNGIYELILYGGITAVIALAASLWALLRLTAAGRKALAVGVMMVLFGTVASSSFLSIESSLLLFLVLARARHSSRASPDMAPAPAVAPTSPLLVSRTPVTRPLRSKVPYGPQAGD